MEINIHEKRIVRQVGYLQRLYRYAGSTERKILGCIVLKLYKKGKVAYV